jgi:hypothetical protein
MSQDIESIVEVNNYRAFGSRTCIAFVCTAIFQLPLINRNHCGPGGFGGGRHRGGGYRGAAAATRCMHGRGRGFDDVIAKLT